MFTAGSKVPFFSVKNFETKKRRLDSSPKDTRSEGGKTPGELRTILNGNKKHKNVLRQAQSKNRRTDFAGDSLRT